jgi:hypothetical protein
MVILGLIVYSNGYVSSGKQVTIGYIEVIDKRESTIIAINPMSNKKEQIELSVEDRNIWNLIEEGKLYVVTYETKNGVSTLSNIRYPN